MMKWVVLMALVVLGGWWVAASTVESQHARPREILFAYVARLPRIPPEAREVRVWIPLAKTGGEQQILRREVRSPVPYAVTEDPEYGNEMLSFSLRPPFPPQVEVVVDYQARLVGGEPPGADRTFAPEELPRYLQARGLLIIDDEVRARAQRATAGRQEVADRARGIYDAVIQQVAYDKTVPGWGRGDTRRVCLLGKGNCTDFHSLFISMARASRIPARFKIGVMIPQDASGTIPGYHCWAEFFVPGRGWVPVDASEAWKHPERADDYFGARDANRLLISVGRDIELVPRQQGEPINIFLYPYVEIDGREAPGIETEFRFHAQQLRRKA